MRVRGVGRGAPASGGTARHQDDAGQRGLRGAQPTPLLRTARFLCSRNSFGTQIDNTRLSPFLTTGKQ